MISQSYFLDNDVVSLSKSLIGCELHTIFDEFHCSGIIIETEAYQGVTDKASHAFGGKYTARTATMFQAGGIAYVYFCYGMHYLFNVVTADEGTPHAILIRAIQPIEGLSIMQKRRGEHIKLTELTNGPAKLCKAMGIDKSSNGLLLQQGGIWIENHELKSGHIISTPRIGVDYAAEDAQLPYRFVWQNTR